MSSVQVTFSLIILNIIIHNIIAQYTDICTTNLGKTGICVRVEQCPAAIKLISQRKHPQLCSFDKIHPIVCCEIVNSETPPKRSTRIAKQKCFEYITITTPTTTTTTTTTIAPDNTSKSQHIPIILSGVNADPLEFPHMALLGYGSGDDIQWNCGGSIISDKFILTAAHCIYSKLGEVTLIAIGVHQITSATFQQFKVEKFYLHPDYKPPQKYNDIALIEIYGQITFTPLGIRPACLQIEKRIVDDVFIATGWGAVANGGYNSDILQKVNLTGVAFETCVRTYNPRRGLDVGLVDDSQMCAGSLQGRGDTCQGDSGGPLQVKLEGSNLYTVVGVTSFGVKCGLLPAVYTRVSYYVPWIENIVWEAQT